MSSDLEKLMAEWQKDSTVNEHKLDIEALRQANLHSKWLDLHTKYKIKVFRIEKDILETKAVLTRYYNGMMDQEELKALGRPQYLHKTPLKGELEKLLESDKDSIDIRQKFYYYTVLEEYCKSVLGAIRDRGFSIKTAVDFIKFAAGG